MESDTVSRGDELPIYSVVTPVRDEAKTFARTARCVVAQDHRPSEWVVVDDGSTDGTREIADKFAANHDWITVISAGSVHSRARGAPIVRAFEKGRAELESRPEITVKMDGDLFLPAHYFAWVAQAFARSASAGIVGGVAMVHDGERWRPDVRTTHHVSGMVKAYRTTCLEQIGGLRQQMGWDGIDEYSARARGWDVHVLTELVFLHYGLRGAKQHWSKARWEEGRGNSYMGYRPSFLALRALYRMGTEPPPVLGGLVLGLGFLAARIRGGDVVDDPEAVALLRQEQRDQLRGLLRGRASVPLPQPPDGGPAFWT